MSAIPSGQSQDPMATFKVANLMPVGRKEAKYRKVGGKNRSKNRRRIGRRIDLNTS
jgi:hypothetical protein